MPGVVRRSTTLAAAILLASSAAASGQWLGHRDPRTPRLPDGQPNLAAPVPRTADGKPDLSGIWNRVDPKYLNNLAADGVEVPFRPWAKALYDERQANLGKDRPSGRCLPHGIPDAMMVPPPFKIVQTDRLVIILYEEFVDYRQIFTDGRSFPADPNPAWFGYSVGRWDGDTLVVETTGFNDRSWLDDGGHPHSDQLRTIERFRRRDFSHMDIEITIDDPKAYTKPWTVRVPFNLLPDTELLEFVCENERDALHLVGK
jgi:hypothetical protein